MRMQRVLEGLHVVVEKHSESVAESLPFKILIGLTIFGHLLSFSYSVFSSLSLYPAQLFAVELWRLFTAPFVGRNVPVFVWSVFSLHYGTRLLRQANTTRALLITLGITQLLTSVFLCILAFASYALFRSSLLLYESPISGLAPSSAAIAVLIKQFLPDSIAFSTRVGRVKYTHMPLNYCLISILLVLIGVARPVIAFEVILGTQIAWTYLRFWQPHATDAVYGDNSDHFAWNTLFPTILRPFCVAVSTVCFRSLVRLGVCKRRVRHVDIFSQQGTTMLLPTMNVSSRDAERRRQKALHELNERLNRTKTVEIDEWPEEEEEDDDETPAQAHKAIESEPTQTEEVEKAEAKEISYA